jgi:hypothetical protein
VWRNGCNVSSLTLVAAGFLHQMQDSTVDEAAGWTLSQDSCRDRRVELFWVEDYWVFEAMVDGRPAQVH